MIDKLKVNIFYNKKFNYILFGILFIIISTSVIGSFMRVGIDGYPRAMFQELVQGKAYKPFVYRRLVPATIKITSSLIPEKIKTEINNLGEKHSDFLKQYISIGELSVELTDLLIAIVIWYLSIFGFALMLMKLINHFYITNERVLLSLALIAVMGLPIFFKFYSYMYDFTNLFLFTLNFYLLARSKWSLYLIFFGLLTFSKETSLFLVFIYFIWYYKKLSKSQFLRLLLIQVLIYIIIKGTINSIYSSNPGTVLEFNIFNNLGNPPYSIAQFVSFILIGLGITYNWKSKPKFLKYSFVVLLPVILGLALLFGIWDEYRIYYEIYPLIFILITHTVLIHYKNIQFQVREKSI